MNERDPVPYIETWGAPEGKAHELRELDAAIYEAPGTYGPAASALAELRTIDTLPEPQQVAAQHIARVLELAGNRISFDAETEDRLASDPHEQALVRQLRAERDPELRERLRRQLSSYRLGAYASKVVARFLAADTSNENPAA